MLLVTTKLAVTSTKQRPPATSETRRRRRVPHRLRYNTIPGD